MAAAPSSSSPPVPAGAPVVGYSFAEAARILGVGEPKLRYWAQTGFVGPSLRRGVNQHYTFADLVATKAAKELVERGFAAAEIRALLDAAAAKAPLASEPAAALRKLRVSFDGQALLFTEAGAAFEASGQRVFEFDLHELAAQADAAHADGGAVVPIDKTGDKTRKGAAAGDKVGKTDIASTVAGRKPTAYDWFLEGLAHAAQAGREQQAAACYRQALAADPGLAAAHTNLGTLACRQGDRPGAREAFARALSLDPEQAEARFNLASLLIEDGETELGAAELRRVLRTAPELADAHYNLATALEALGGRAQAREHLEEFLRLAPAGDDDPWVAEAHRRLQRLR